MTSSAADEKPLTVTTEHASDEAWEKRVIGKVALRLIPFIFLMYVVNILDRINIGFAKLNMAEDLHLTEDDFGLGFGIFFIGYFIFEIPSNMIMEKVGAKRWMARIMITWGIVSCCMMFIKGTASFYLLRFLLGVAEAGFFPGMILYLTYWFPSAHRARTVALFMTASAVAGLLGNPLSGYLLEVTKELGGPHPWQWLFLLEGIPAVVLGVISLLYLTDRPEKAAWLSEEERNWLAQRMSREDQDRVRQHGLTSFKALRDKRVVLLCLLYFVAAMGANGFGVWLPTLIQKQFEGTTKTVLGLLGAIPYIVAVVIMILASRHSDRTRERRWHVALASLIGAAGWWLASLEGSPWFHLAALSIAAIGMWSMLAPFWALPTAFLSKSARAGGIAMINSIGNLGGFVAPYMLGYTKEKTKSFTLGLTIMALTFLVGFALALRVKHRPADEDALPDI